MAFTPKTWVNGTLVDAAAMTDLETRLSAYTDLGVKIVARTADSSGMTANTTMTADGVLLFPITGVSGDMWFVEAFVSHVGTNTAMDIKLGWSVPTGSAINWGVGWIAGATGLPGSPSVATTTAAIAVLNAGGTAAFPTGANAPQFAFINGFVTSGSTSGNVNLTWAQNTSDAAALVVQKGSFLRITRLV